MNGQVSFTLRGRNPDVLTCIANLSNDEVFTPPELAGRMLDMLAEAWAADHGGGSLWADHRAVFGPVYPIGRFSARNHQPLDREPGARHSRPARACEPHPDAAGVWHWHHAADQPAGAAQRVLLQICQWRAFHCQGF